MAEVRETDTQQAAKAPPAVSKSGTPQFKSSIPQFKDNPIRAIGLVLSNVSAGMQGRPLPTDIIRQQDQERRMMEMQQLGMTLNAVQKGVELFGGADPDDPKMQEFIGKFSEVLPGFGEAFNTAMEVSQKSGMSALTGAGEHLEKVYGICGLDRDCIKNVISDSNLMKRLDDTADQQRMPSILKKFQIIGEAVGGEEELQKLIADGTWSIGDLKQLPEEFGFTDSELRTISRNEDIQNALIEYGFQPPGVARKEAESKASAQDPEIIKLQEDRDRAVREGRSNDARDIQARIDKLTTIVGRTAEDVGLTKGDPKRIGEVREKMRSLRGDMDQLEKTLGAFIETPEAAGAVGAILEKAAGIAGQVDLVLGTDIENLVPGDREKIQEARTRAKFLAGSMLETITKEESGRFTDTERRIANEALKTLEAASSPGQIKTSLKTAMDIMNDSLVRQGEELLDASKLDLNDVNNLDPFHGILIKNGLTSEQADALILDILDKRGIRLE